MPVNPASEALHELAVALDEPGLIPIGNRDKMR